MIITRTPLRVSFFGGGTDFPEFFEEEGGAVVSSAVNFYSYQVVTEFPSQLFDHVIRLSYSRGELVKSVDEIQHPVFRACLRHCGLERDIEIHVATDLPAFTGLGSSSSFMVGLLHALHAFKGEQVLPSLLAEEAIQLERDVLAECIGCQDQTAAAYGGFNLIEFRRDAGPRVTNLAISARNIELLQSHLLLVFTRLKRRAQDVERTKLWAMRGDRAILRELKQQAHVATALFESRQDLDLRGLAELLEEAWTLKKRLSPLVTSPEIDEYYERARQAGAIGGKLLGAGGGGFLLLLAPAETHDRIRAAFPGHFTTTIELGVRGSEVIFPGPTVGGGRR